MSRREHPGAPPIRSPARSEVRGRAAARGRWTIAWVVAALIAGCGGAITSAPPPAASAAADGDAHLVRSNILRTDYAGSQACAGCHAEIHERWRGSPMQGMTRLAPDAHIDAPFRGDVFAFKGDTATMEEHEGRKYMRLASRKGGASLYRITKVIGGRYREDFAGVEVADTSAAGSAGDLRKERVMPVSFLRFSKTWRYKGYSVMVPERDRLAPGVVWRQTCIFCHNTTPLLSTLYDDLGGGDTKYQGSVSDGFLPDSRRWRFEAAAPAELARVVAGEIARLDEEHRPPEEASLNDVLAEAARATRRRFDESHLVEIGVGCEACHNGSKEHAAEPIRRPTFEIRSALVRVATPREAPPTRAQWINRTCARCHTVLFSEYAHTWEGGRRSGSPGGSPINSGEARDMLLGGCATAMSCVDCHDPHAADSPDSMAKLGSAEGNAVCAGCHAEKSGDDAVRAHTHHRPDGEGSACLACHMPRKNMGLAYRLTRYHRVGSPTDRARVEGDRPLECALCHADRPVSALVDAMERWWGKRYDRGALRALYGDDLGARPLEATIARGKPHEQAVAAAALGERGGAADIPALLPLLTHDLPLVRHYARRSIEALAGRPMDIDLDADRARIKEQAARWARDLPMR